MKHEIDNLMGNTKIMIIKLLCLTYKHVNMNEYFKCSLSLLCGRTALYIIILFFYGLVSALIHGHTLRSSNMQLNLNLKFENFSPPNLLMKMNNI